MEPRPSMLAGLTALLLLPVVLTTVSADVSRGERAAFDAWAARLPAIRATTIEAAPAWAVMQRRLMDTMNSAVPLFVDKYVNPGGTFREHGKLDDDYECFANWPLFYMMGGDEYLLDMSLDLWNGVTRQWTWQHRREVGDEFVKANDMLHLSEGYVGFQYFGLADPDISENVMRARRFAGFYLGDEGGVGNYDPVLRLIRSPITGSAGPSFERGCEYVLVYGHASLWPVLKELPEGWRDDDPERDRIQRIYNDIVISGDVPMNMAVTGLMSHAFLLTGDDRYRDWVLDYVEAWRERTRMNGGVIPDNIALDGTIGGRRDGQWWGGFFGWTGRYSVWMIFHALITATECATVLTGDVSHMDFLRSQVDMLLDMAIERDGDLLVPYKVGPDGWYDYRPLDPYILSHLWHATMDPDDRGRIERLREGVTHGPHAYAYAESPDPPEPGSEEWRPDGTRFDWNFVDDTVYGNKHVQNEAPHLNFLAGRNPGWPEAIMRAELNQVRRNIARLSSDDYVHRWRSQTLLAQNPVFTNGLAQMTMGAPFTCFNGGLLRGRVRYFDADRARPGLPPGTSALVRTLDADRTVLELVNTDPFATHRAIVQAGPYREHSFTSARFTTESTDDDKDTVTRGDIVAIDGPWLLVELPPSTSITLDMGTERFANSPTYAFPWREDD